MSSSLRAVPDQPHDPLTPAGEPGLRDWGAHAQKVAEDHLAACLEWESWYEEGGEDSGEPAPSVPDPSVGPFCGCTTCFVRETLAAAWPVIEAAVRSGDFDDPGA